jgi:hypothetical protein
LLSFSTVEGSTYSMKIKATTMNKKPTRCTIVLTSLKLYCILIPLYMFRALLRPSSGAFRDSSDRPKLEATTNPTTHGAWRLYVQI